MFLGKAKEQHLGLVPTTAEHHSSNQWNAETEHMYIMPILAGTKPYGFNTILEKMTKIGI